MTIWAACSRGWTRGAHTKMIFGGRWKYIRCEGFDLILFNLETGPDELVDLGTSDTTLHPETRTRM
ncbi:MAG: hypothetical protein ACSHXH_16910 [Marivita sp.]|uniref:hypothetical protein n=1 Tax=Marivita sp. TaxID=2003365 RepID=UPI003EF2FCBC